MTQFSVPAGVIETPSGEFVPRLYVNGNGGSLGSVTFWLMSRLNVSPDLMDSIGSAG